MFSSFNCTTQLPESQFSDQGLNQSHSMESSESSPPGHQGTPQEFLNKNVFIVFGSLSVVFFCLFVCLHFAACFMLLLLLLLSHFSHVRLCGTPQTAAHQAPLSLGFSRQEHWSGLPLPSLMHESEIPQSCPALSDPMDCSLPISSTVGFSSQKYWSGLPLPSPHVHTTIF